MIATDPLLMGMHARQIFTMVVNTGAPIVWPQGDLSSVSTMESTSTLQPLKTVV